MGTLHPAYKPLEADSMHVFEKSARCAAPPMSVVPVHGTYGGNDCP